MKNNAFFCLESMRSPINSLYLPYEKRIWKVADGHSQVHHHGSSINLHFRLRRAGMDYLYRRFYLYIINPRFWLVSCPG